MRQYSFWEVIANTINGGTTDLYVVLDEAHRGVKPATDRKTIVQRIIAGAPGSHPAVPLVWGISATIARFTTAMEGVADRTNFPHVEVDVDRVRASGLIKDEIGLDEPDENGAFGSTLLREAVRSTLDYDRRWRDYATEQNSPEVLPVLVVQVADKASDAHLTEIVNVIDSEWPALGPGAVAHVFGEHDRLHVAGRAVDWVPPESIEDDHAIRVVLAKTAISTGWDCPRAEVLYSERPAADSTHIAQIIGRMVRSPLAHRIATDDALNTVACYLPKFNRDALYAIKDELEGNGKSGAEGRVGATVVRAPKVFERNPHLPADVFDLIEDLPSLPAPDALANPLRRAKELTRLLTDNVTGSALLPDAGQRLTSPRYSPPAGRSTSTGGTHAVSCASSTSPRHLATCSLLNSTGVHTRRHHPTGGNRYRCDTGQPIPVRPKPGATAIRERMRQTGSEMEPDAQLAPRVLLAVSDAILRRVAAAALRARGFSVSATTEEDAALTLARSFSPDVVMVDLSLSSPEGGNLFDTMRNLTDAYIVGIAPPDSDSARIRALRAGADDVVSVPINPDELAARCQALLRRPRQLHARWDPMQASVINMGPLTVDVGRKEIRVRGQDVPVTRIEFALFEQLCRRPAEVCARVQLVEEVWGPNWVGDTHVVDVHLSNLRRKLQALAPELRFIHTVRGVGFRLSNDLVRHEDEIDRELASA